MPNNANVQFKRGLLANMPSAVQDGTIYVTTDEHAMYVDNGNQRIRIGDFIPVNTVNDLPAAGHVYETAVYYVKTGNILARWDKTNNRWIQINKAGIVGVETSGSGNVVSEITVGQAAADGTLQLQVTKIRVASQADLQDVVDTVQQNTTDLTALKHEVYDVIEGDVNTEGSILNLIDAARTALLGGETTYTTLKAIGDWIRTADTTITRYGTRLSDAEDDIEALQTTVGQHTTTLNTLTADAETPGSIEHTVSEAIAAVIANAPEDFDTLKELADWISTHGAEAAQMNTRITGLRTDVNDLLDRMQVAENDIDALEGRMDTAESDIDDLQDDINTLNGDASTEGSIAYKIAQSLTPINTRLRDVEDDTAIAIDRLTWKNFDPTEPEGSGEG